VSVTDATNHPSGFTPSSTPLSQDAYEYDAFGNLTKDRHKGITNIIYNHLHQPKELFVSNGTHTGSISYLYDANGKKVQKQVMEGQRLTIIDYLDGFQYLDGKLDFLPHAEGYVKAVHTGSTTEYHYVFHYTDHLGNIRLSYGRDPETNEIAILKESHYYPFGLQHNGYVGTHRTTGIIEEIGGSHRVSLIPVRNYLDDSYRYTF